ncbi:MAG: hypothetical protein MJ239_02935 [Bacilli bacterium]|nr:hypothetical protein [Bacilli bacterium]
MKILKKKIIPNHGTIIEDESISFEPSLFDGNPDIKNIENGRVEGEIDKNSKGFFSVYLHFLGDVTLMDSSTGELFVTSIEVEDDFDVLNNPLDDGEGYIEDGDYIDVSRLIVSLIRTNLPTIIHKGDKIGPYLLDDGADEE